MKLKRPLILVSLSLLLRAVLLDADVGPRDQRSNHSSLTLSVTTDMSALRVGDSIRITCMITNHTNRPIRFLRWPSDSGGVGWLEMRDSAGVALSVVDFGHVQSALVPSKSNVVPIDPNQPLKVRYTGRMVRGPLTTWDRRAVKGFVLVLNTGAVESGFVLEKPGRYQLRAKTFWNQWVQDQAKEYLPDTEVFNQRLESEWLELELREEQK